MSVKNYTDEEIIEKLSALSESGIRHREAEAVYFNELFNRYYSQAYSFIRYYGLSHEDTRDVIQECFIRIYNLGKTYKKGKPFKPWFFKVILNLVRDKYGELKRKKYHDIDNYIDDPAISKEENIIEKLQNNDYIRSILNRLPTRLKEVLTLKFYSEMSMTEIAETLGIQQRQAYNILEQAYKEFKKVLEAEE